MGRRLSAQDLAPRPARRAPSLEEALLLGRFPAYARYRLRYLAVLTLLSTLLHGIEVDLLLAAYPLDELVPLLAYRAAAAVVGPWWWGALEQLRSEVRELSRARRYRRAADRIEAWLGAALWLGAGAMVTTLCLLWLRPTPGRHPNLYDVYAVCCALRLAVDVVVRTYHAGRFALGRVYRPFWSVALPTLVEGSGLVVLWFWVGLSVWALPAALLLGTFVRSSLSFAFAHRAYAQSRLGRVRLTRALFRPLAVGRASALSALRFLAASSVSQLDGLLILVLVMQPDRAGATAFGVLYYVLSPLMATAHKWCRVFYFDLQRLSSASHAFMRARLERSLRALAWLCALAVSALTALAALTLLRAEVGLAPLALVPLFVARSHFSLSQLQAFAYQRLRPLVWLTTLPALALLIVSQTRAAAALVVLDVSWVLGLSAWLAGRLTSGRRAEPTGAALGLHAFLRHVAATQHGVQLAVMQVDRKLARVRDLQRALLARFVGAPCCATGRSSLCLALAPGDPELVAKLHAETGGTLGKLHVVSADSGPSALSHLSAQRRLPALPQRRLEQDPREPRALRDACRAAGGYALEIDAVAQSVRPAQAAPARLDARTALDALAREIEGGESLGLAAAPLVCAYAPAGQLKWAFIWPRSEPQLLPLREEIRARCAHDCLHLPESPTPFRARAHSVGAHLG